MNMSRTSSDDHLEEDYVILADTVVTDALNSISFESSPHPQAPPPSPPILPPPPLPLKRRDKSRQIIDKEQGSTTVRHSDQPHQCNHQHNDKHRSRRHANRSHSGGHFVTENQQEKAKERQHGRHRKRTPGHRLSEGERSPHSVELEDFLDDEGESADAPGDFHSAKDVVPKSSSNPFIHAARDTKLHYVSQEDLDPIGEDLDGRTNNIQSHSEGCQATRQDYSRHQPHTPARKIQAKRAYSDSRLGAKEGSRSPSRLLQGQDKGDETFCEGLNAGSMIFDPDPRGPSTTVIHINNMSEYQMHIFPEETTEELQRTSHSAYSCGSQTREDDPGADRSVDVSGDGMDQENSMSAMSIVSELVGGLDSQIRTLCRNLEVLLLSRGSGSPGGEGEKETVTNVKACGDSTCLGDVDEPERFYDCFSTDGETRNEYLDCLVKHTSDLPTGSERRYRQDGPGTAHTASKPRHAPLIPAPGIPPERESTRRTEDQSRDWLEIAGGGGESTHPRHSPVRQPPAPRPPPRPPKNLPPLSQEQPTGPLERSRTLTYKSGSDGESVGVAGQYKPQCSKQETAKPGHVQSMLTLPPRAKAREAFNVIEICTESSSSSDSVVEKACGAAKDSADAEGGGSVRWGRAGGGLHKLMSRELSQVFDQSDVLRTMWNNHKTQLCDLLATREREAARAERLEQALGRARNLVTSLRRQRRDLHRYLEQKEEEWASVLRCHRNEAAFLRRKVLTGLEEKKNVLADPKRDGKFAAVLDSLLSLHIDREQFLALDLAKQNKIHELKLLAVRQQLALEELKERNSDLNHALSSLLQCLPGPSAAPPHQPRAPCSPHPRATTTSTTVSSGCVLGPRGPGLADMLYCDRSIFLPRHPTSPDLAAVTVFSVGGEQSPISSPVEEVFDASRQRCYADGDNFNHHGDGAVSESNMSTLAEELLRELTLYGPGNPDFTLADSN